MHVTGRLMMASVDSWIVGSGRSSNRMSWAPYKTVACMSHPVRNHPGGRTCPFSHRVARLFVERVGLADNVRLVHLLAPFVGVDFFERDRHRFVAVVQYLHHVVG